MLLPRQYDVTATPIRCYCHINTMLLPRQHHSAVLQQEVLQLNSAKYNSRISHCLFVLCVWCVVTWYGVVCVCVCGVVCVCGAYWCGVLRCGVCVCVWCVCGLCGVRIGVVCCGVECVRVRVVWLCVHACVWCGVCVRVCGVRVV